MKNKEKTRCPKKETLKRSLEYASEASISHSKAHANSLQSIAARKRRYDP